MVSNGIPIPENDKHAKLMTAFADELKKSTHMSMGECMALAGYLAERTVKEGWKPPVNELTPEEEVDLMDRIISGLPVAYTQPANPEGNYKYGVQKAVLHNVTSLHPQEIVLTDVTVLHPQVVNDWDRIPTWDNYEINRLGFVRNRWTKRVLEFVNDGEDNEQYVEMHDKEGFTHFCHIPYLLEQTFGK